MLAEASGTMALIRKSNRPRDFGQPKIGAGKKVLYAFDSPSAAAAVVSGTGLNGRVSWKVKGQNISYKMWEEQQLAAGGA